MRIGLDVSPAAAPEPSGSGVYAEGLLRGLLAVAPARARLVAGWRPARGRARRHLPDLDDPRVAFRPFVGAAARLTLGRLDLFHGSATGLPRTLGCPLVLTIHSLHTLEPGAAETFDGPDRRARRRARIERLVARADAVICLTGGGRRRFLERFAGFPPERARAVPHGVDLDRFRPTEALSGAEVAGDAVVLARHGLEPGYVLHVARVQRRKNTARLVRAFGRCGAARGRTLAVAGGRGHGAEEALAEAERLGRSGPAGRVRLLGPVGRDDLPALYRGAAAFALPSLYEEFGLPVLEAFACGVPVVASSAPSLPEVAGDAALLPDPGSDDEVAAALETAIADESRRASLRARGLERAAAHAWPSCAARTWSLYATLVPALAGAAGGVPSRPD